VTSPRGAGLADAVARQDLAALDAALARHAGAIPARAVVLAAQRAWTAGLAALLRAGADLDAGHRNYRPLHALIQAEPHAAGPSTPERVACLEWLLAHGADPEQTGAWPAARALIVAAFEGQPGYVEVLRRAGARTDLFTAAALGDAVTVAAVLAGDPERSRARDAGLLTALQCCAGSRLGRDDRTVAAGLLECARRLIDAGADVDARTRSWGHDVAVSYFAIRANQRELLELLLARGLDATGGVAAAAWDGHEPFLDLLLAHGARLDDAADGGKPVLNQLVRWGQFAKARLLLARGASPNVPDERGRTAVHQAVSRGNVAMLRDLLAAGGDPARRDHEGLTPRDWAFARGPLAAVLGQGRSAADAILGARRCSS